jgi:hypothetical protein
MVSKPVIVLHGFAVLQSPGCSFLKCNAVRSKIKSGIFKHGFFKTLSAIIVAQQVREGAIVCRNRAL